jgi:hypothetical protein
MYQKTSQTTAWESDANTTVAAPKHRKHTRPVYKLVMLGDPFDFTATAVHYAHPYHITTTVLPPFLYAEQGVWHLGENPRKVQRRGKQGGASGSKRDAISKKKGYVQYTRASGVWLRGMAKAAHPWSGVPYPWCNVPSAGTVKEVKNPYTSSIEYLPCNGMHVLVTIKCISAPPPPPGSTSPTSAPTATPTAPLTTSPPTPVPVPYDFAHQCYLLRRQVSA